MAFVWPPKTKEQVKIKSNGIVLYSETKKKEKNYNNLNKTIHTNNDVRPASLFRSSNVGCLPISWPMS